MYCFISIIYMEYFKINQYIKGIIDMIYKCKLVSLEKVGQTDRKRRFSFTRFFYKIPLCIMPQAHYCISPVSPLWCTLLAYQSEPHNSHFL